MIKADTRKLAKNIFQETAKSDTALDKIIQILVKDSSPNAKAILMQLQKLLEKKQKENQLIIESSFELDPEVKDEFLAKFEKLLGKKLETIEIRNKDLIGGIKIKNEDFVWENSIRSNLEMMKGVIIND